MLNDTAIPNGLIQHIKRWNKWRKYNCNGRVHKLRVLLGVVNSPTFMLTFLDEEIGRPAHESQETN